MRQEEEPKGEKLFLKPEDFHLSRFLFLEAKTESPSDHMETIQNNSKKGLTTKYNP
jgi:hypothetical protein